MKVNVCQDQPPLLFLIYNAQYIKSHVQKDLIYKVVYIVYAVIYIIIHIFLTCLSP